MSITAAFDPRNVLRLNGTVGASKVSGYGVTTLLQESTVTKEAMADVADAVIALALSMALDNTQAEAIRNVLETMDTANRGRYRGMAKQKVEALSDEERFLLSASIPNLKLA